MGQGPGHALEVWSVGTTEELSPESEAHAATRLPIPTRDILTSQRPATCPTNNPGVLLECSLSQGLWAILMGSPAKQATFLSAEGVPHILTTGKLACLALEGCRQAAATVRAVPLSLHTLSCPCGGMAGLRNWPGAVSKSLQDRKPLLNTC